MKTITAIASIGAIVVLFMGIGFSQSLSEWLMKPGGSPPVITHWYASEELHHGDIWKIYLGAKDPDGDMINFVILFDQQGFGVYSPGYVVIKKQHRGELRGYLRWFSTSGDGLSLPEWTRVNVTIFIRDKGGNISNKVAFPLVLSRGTKQGPPPPPFDNGPLDKLGTIMVDLLDPNRDSASETEPWWIK
ncbi:MAG: hypothetical protein ACETWT_01630 [Thermodesulfobacteriota bacterium]